jgi:hypothetical protein
MGVRKSCLLLVALAAVVDAAATATQVRTSPGGRRHLQQPIRVANARLSAINSTGKSACIVTLHTLQGCASPVARGLDNVMMMMMVVGKPMHVRPFFFFTDTANVPLRVADGGGRDRQDAAPPAPE